ncbi:hypothetical protein [Streptomyces agglomeratus]|uniref:hypothetical protein n=1 Tax=Streptomyces agglomeratus TaxID=285458 RepID=UPI001F0B21CA|nr:hypothetical protein [Streptomyces agglomeratus]
MNSAFGVLDRIEDSDPADHDLRTRDGDRPRSCTCSFRHVELKPADRRLILPILGPDSGIKTARAEVIRLYLSLHPALEDLLEPLHGVK